MVRIRVVVTVLVSCHLERAREEISAVEQRARRDD